jgi:hypothetical protein
MHLSSQIKYLQSQQFVFMASHDFAEQEVQYSIHFFLETNLGGSLLSA